ncbi:MAG: NTP transferase domain-containing protein [Nitrospirota bacterium]
MAHDKTVAFIPVRLTSTRLPEKHLKTIGMKSIISWVIHQLKRSVEIDDIVICCPNEPETEKLRPIASSEAVELFIYEGSVDDVVGRLTKAAETYKADICVLASGDCPLLCPETIDSMVRLLKADPEAGHAAFMPLNNYLPIHEGIVISRRWLWQRAEELSDTPELREHHFPVFLRGVYPEKFADVKTIFFQDDDCFYSLRHRISVDTPFDLTFMNTLYDELKKSSQDFTLQNAIALMRGNNTIGMINNRVYQKGFGEQSYRVLFISNCVNDGGSLIRCLDTADALVHYHGIGAEFLVADRDASSIVSKRSYKAVTGTRGDILKLSMKYSALVYDIDKYYNIEIPLTGSCKVRENTPLLKSPCIESVADEIAKLIKK